MNNGHRLKKRAAKTFRSQETEPVGLTGYTEISHLGNECPTKRILHVQQVDTDTCKTFAAKQVTHAKDGLREIKIMRLLHHENIVQAHDFRFEGTGGWIIMELALGSNLRQCLHRSKASVARNALVYTQQLLSAVKHMHSRKVVHRDLKPENIILSEATKQGHIVLIDFDLSAIFSWLVAKHCARTSHSLCSSTVTDACKDCICTHDCNS